MLRWPPVSGPAFSVQAINRPGRTGSEVSEVQEVEGGYRGRSACVVGTENSEYRRGRRLLCDGHGLGSDEREGFR